MPRFTIAELAAVFDEGTTLMDILESHRWATAERARSRRKASRRRAQGRAEPSAAAAALFVARPSHADDVPIREWFKIPAKKEEVDGKAAFEASCREAWGAISVEDSSGVKLDASGAAK